MSLHMENLEKSIAEDFPVSFLKNVHMLRQESLFTDVHLVVCNREFAAHKLVLAAASPYFRAMFMSDMTEGKLDRITLHDIGASVFEDLLTFMYSGEFYCMAFSNNLFSANMLHL